MRIWKRLGRNGNGEWDALHAVSAWAGEEEIIPGQAAADEKSNEIRAIPKLLGLLDIKGAVVTINAMGCRKELAAKIRERGGDYLPAAKENQPTLHQDISEYAGMEDIPEYIPRYTQERNENRPLVCIDECPKQPIGETRSPLPGKPRCPACFDRE